MARDQRLMSVPGIGPVTSMRFVSAIDDVTRFNNAHAVQGFLGLTPGEHSSSNKQQRLGITKAGPAPVRRALTQAAWSFRRTCPHHPIALWAAQIELRRGKFIATIAVARKLAGVLFAVWRDGGSCALGGFEKARRGPTWGRRVRCGTAGGSGAVAEGAFG